MAIVALELALAVASPAWAHHPVWAEGHGATAETAIAIADPDLSQVVYHELTAAAPSLWLRFSGQKGQQVYLQIGVPAIERLAAFRPAMALVGPGLAEQQLPVGLPSGCGALAFPTGEVADPRLFREPFTGTDSWILREERATLPETGTYFAVAYEPSGDMGKLWLSVGTREEWGARDVARLPGWTREIRRFHEVGGWPLWQQLAGLGVLAAVAGGIWAGVRLGVRLFRRRQLAARH